MAIAAGDPQKFWQLVPSRDLELSGTFKALHMCWSCDVTDSTAPVTNFELLRALTASEPGKNGGSCHYHYQWGSWRHRSLHQTIRRPSIDKSPSSCPPWPFAKHVAASSERHSPITEPTPLATGGVHLTVSEKTGFCGGEGAPWGTRYRRQPITIVHDRNAACSKPSSLFL